MREIDQWVGEAMGGRRQDDRRSDRGGRNGQGTSRDVDWYE